MACFRPTIGVENLEKTVHLMHKFWSRGVRDTAKSALFRLEYLLEIKTFFENANADEGAI